MLPIELSDYRLVGVISMGEDRRTLVHPFAPYVNLKHQVFHHAERGDAHDYWRTTSEVDFVDVQPAFIEALQKALEEKKAADSKNQNSQV